MRILIIFICSALLMSCDYQREQPHSASGAKKLTVQVQTDAQGYTTEQKNVSQRLLEDNKPGAIKHLYVISAYSGQVLIYSTVRGKVTSSGKRLTPVTVAAAVGQYDTGIPVTIGNYNLRTPEVLQDDGTYGSSVEYLFWWDTKGVYHQQYVTGGMILHISNQPLAIKSVMLNMETSVVKSE
jgi:hypothetical protein